MPDRRHHRGAHPSDRLLFAEPNLQELRQAVSDLSWLMTKGYAPAASLKLVGDRYELRARQRLAVARAACSDQQRARRLAGRIPLFERSRILIDGFNLLITIEAALSGGPLLLCRDGLIRDLSSVHGSYRAVDETENAILLIGSFLETQETAAAEWLLDQPVSNSGRLAGRIREIAGERNWPWTVRLDFNPDKLLRNSDAIVITSDSNILDAGVMWVEAVRLILGDRLNSCWVVDLCETDKSAALLPGAPASPPAPVS
ncbi:MAG: DUF434 domain-containing protein [Blastocatellales bacterium]